MIKLRLPWKIQNAINILKIKFIKKFTNRVFRKILLTPPVVSHNDSDIEVHSLVDHGYLIYYLVAIKSLCHFSGLKLSIYCHCCNRNMSPGDVALLKKHVVGVNYIERDYADNKMRDDLSPFRTCFKYRLKQENIIGTSAKFFDQLLISKADKLILMDADTLFFNSPTEIIDWAVSSGSESLYLKDIVNWFCIPYPEINSVKGLPTKVSALFNAGLLCFDKRPLVTNLKLVEEVMETIEANKGDFSGLDQTLFALLLPNQRQLSEKDYSCEIRREVAKNKNVVFKHYVGRDVRSSSFIYCREGKRVIQELLKNHYSK